MRRQDIQLLATARQGDAAARCEVGRRYLLGVDGFPRHVASGLEHLGQPNTRDLPQAARIVAESLPLAELLEHGLESALHRAAKDGSAAAQLKLAAWLALQGARPDEAARWLAAAARQGEAHATALIADEKSVLAVGASPPAWLATLRGVPSLQLPAAALLALARAVANDSSAALPRTLATALQLADDPADAEWRARFAPLAVQAVARAEAAGRALSGVPLRPLLDILEQRAGQGDRVAAYALGRVFCGIAFAAFDPAEAADLQNMRRGAAFLLRAADAGQDEAWLHLYRVHSDHRLSVANPQMARFFLEKAALRGQAEAQRKLGALLLREAGSLPESEQAIHWLHQAAAQGDEPAAALLKSLVLPVPGADDEAAQALQQIGRSDPWLAVRLQLARLFGLTRLEALCIDPAEGLRPWGLVVGRNPFITQARLAAPRAVPALSAAALEAARRAASLFGQSRGQGEGAEGDLRKRTARQRRAFERHGLDEDLFFAEASSMTLEALRLGPKWAFRARQPLQAALAA
jgi:TPR repeat protein